MQTNQDPYKDPYYKGLKDTEQKNQFSDSGIYIKEDDQDWGSSGMNDIQASQE